MKPKINRIGSKYKSSKYDRCQTPFYALDPLIPYLSKNQIIWECAEGDGNIVTKLLLDGFDVFGSDILDGYNFFEWDLDRWDCIVTNPPYSIKYDWIERCYELGKPWALLMPVETMGAARAQRQFKERGIEVILLSRRVNFKMPDKGYDGGGAQFPVCWYTWGLGLGNALVFGEIEYYKDEA